MCNSLFLAFLAGLDNFPEDCCYEGAYEGTYDEYPNICQSFAACKDGGTNGTSGVNTCACEVDAYKMDEYQGKTDGETCKACRCAVRLMRGSKHYKHEECSQNSLYNESHYNIVVATCNAVSSKAAFSAIEINQKCSCEDTANDLSAHITAAVLEADATCAEATQSDGRIDVATRDAANGIGHGNYRETKGNGRSNYCGCVCFCTTKTDSCTAAQECQYKRTDAFSNVLFHFDFC